MPGNFQYCGWTCWLVNQLLFQPAHWWGWTAAPLQPDYQVAAVSWSLSCRTPDKYFSYYWQMRNTQSTFCISGLINPHIFCSPYSLQLSQYPAVFPARWTWPQRWRLWSSLTPQSGQTLQVGEWNENSAFVGIRTFWWGIEVGQISCWKNTYDSTSLQKGLLWITNTHAVVSWL